MRTSATGTSTDRWPFRLAAYRPRARGFSLIELLVVTAIIGLFAGAAVLSLSTLGGDRELERETLRLRSLLDVLMEEAVLETRDYGVMFTQSGYRFYVYDPQQLYWLDPVGDYFLSRHSLAEPLSLALSMEDREVALATEFRPQLLEAPKPQVIVLASGEITPFEAGFYRDPNGGRYVLTGTLDGTLEISARDFDGL